MELLNRAVDENGGPEKYSVKDVYASLEKIWPETAFDLDYNKVNCKLHAMACKKKKKATEVANVGAGTSAAHAAAAAPTPPTKAATLPSAPAPPKKRKKRSEPAPHAEGVTPSAPTTPAVGPDAEAAEAPITTGTASGPAASGEVEPDDAASPEPPPGRAPAAVAASALLAAALKIPSGEHFVKVTEWAYAALYVAFELAKADTAVCALPGRVANATMGNM